MIFYQHIAVIGAGLVGSSLLRAVRAGGLAHKTSVYDNDGDVRSRLPGLGLADHVAETAAEAVAGADLVVLAVPVGAMADATAAMAPGLTPGLTPGLNKGVVITDTGSTKASVLRDVAPLIPDGCYFLPSHPVAGTEYSGPEAGFATLFKDRYWIVLPKNLPQDVPADITAHFKDFLAATGAMVEEMEIDYHDRILAITSHLPHLIAYTIVGTAFDFETQLQNDVIRYSASGFRDFTRIAASDPVMWRDVFLNNSDAILEMLGRFNEDLSYLQRAIRWKEGDKLEELFTRTRAIRNRIRDIGQLD